MPPDVPRPVQRRDIEGLYHTALTLDAAEHTEKLHT